MDMKEFGSDFHKCDFDFRVEEYQLGMYGYTCFYACGRHAIDAIIKQEGWKRIWMPAYFCYEVIGHIRSTGIETLFYDDYPLNEHDDDVVRNLPYLEGDVLFRTDYFGLRKWRTNASISVPVIEDHTHGLITDWALRSDADWCIASLRKSLPVAAGGVLWSPKGRPLPDGIQPTDDCIEMARIRYEAMAMKAEYLRTSYVTEQMDADAKNAFREKYIDTDERIDNLTLSGADPESESITRALNIKHWTDLKLDNWRIATKLLDKRFNVLGTERDIYWQPFSLVLLMDSAEERARLRQYMVQQKIYPAVLWIMPENSKFVVAKDFSERMLSVHCDNRYSWDAITEMCNLINRFYDTDF